MISPMRLFKSKKSGYWYVSFERGKERSLKTRDEKEARGIFKAMERAWLKGRLIKLDNENRITLSAFTEQYVARRKLEGLDSDTTRMDSLALRSLADVVGPNAALKAINDKKIAQFKTTCLTRGIKKTSVNSYLRHIRAAFNSAHEDGIINKVPAIKNFKIGRRLPVILSPDEIKQLLAYAEKTDYEIFRIAKFAVWTGCRREEISTAKWQDVSGPGIRIIGKGDKERLVPLLPGALEAMGKKKNIGLIFHRWHKDTISKKFKAAAIGAGLAHIHFHSLRHSAATQMINSGIRMEVVQEILGHVDIRTTKIYAQVLGSVMAEEMKKLTY